jgi:predicted Zn-dependent peptidase
MTRRLLALAATVLLTASISAQQAPDRSRPPKPGPAPALKIPEIQKRTLANGLPVWVAELHEVPLAHVTLVVRAGAATDPAGKFGLASMTAELLDEGAGTRNALEIADAVDFLGADLSTDSSSDAATISLHVPVARLGDALPIMADVALRPQFPEKELQRVREELLAALIQAQDDPASVVQIAFPQLVYGPTHRYGTPDFGSAAAIKGFAIADLKTHHARFYTPANAALIVSGDITADGVMPLLEKAFGEWKSAAGAKVPPLPAPKQLGAREVILIDKPGAAQSQIRIGWVGIPRSTPDYFAVRVMNTVLGGAFTSRLNTNLREQHGYSYGASSAFDMRLGPGPFYAGAGVQTDKTAEALKEFFNELERIRQPIPADELEKAKNYVALRMPRSFETTRSLAASLSQAFIYGLPDDYFATFTERVRAVTPADAQRVAERYIQPDKFAVVVVGDRKTIEPGIRALKLGPVRTVTIEEVFK